MSDHYKDWVVGDFIDEMGLSFNEGNVVKYISRYKKKGGLNDLKKARDYLSRIIEQEEQKTGAIVRNLQPPPF